MPPTPTNPLEIAAFNVPSAIAAVRAGASRVELCGGAKAGGGITPELEDFKTLKAWMDKEDMRHVPVMVMIRPCEGGFEYAEEVLGGMEDSIRQFIQAGAQGFVFGVLSDGGRRIADANRRLVDVAREDGIRRLCTFHRAFDGLDMEETARSENLEVMRGMGFDAVLSSGVEGKGAWEGREVLKCLRGEAAERGLSLIIGGGVRSEGLEDLRGMLGEGWWHSGASVGGGEDVNSEEVRRLVGVLRGE